MVTGGMGYDPGESQGHSMKCKHQTVADMALDFSSLPFEEKYSNMQFIATDIQLFFICLLGLTFAYYMQFLLKDEIREIFLRTIYTFLQKMDVVVMGLATIFLWSES